METGSTGALHTTEQSISTDILPAHKTESEEEGGKLGTGKTSQAAQARAESLCSAVSERYQRSR